jgi:hypothetical protein
MTWNFRQLARESVGRARAELASGDRARLKFAALELRMAIESMTPTTRRRCGGCL